MVDSVFKKVLEILSASGDYADVFYEDVKNLSAVYEDGRLKRIDNIRDEGVGLRIIKDGRTFYASTQNMQEDELIELAKELSSALQTSPGGLTLSAPSHQKMFQRDPSEIDIKKKISALEDMNKVLTSDSRIVQATSVIKDSVRRTRVLNSFGADVSQDASYVTSFAMAIAQNGEEIQTGYEPWGGTFGAEGYDMFDHEAVAKKALNRALLCLEADYAPAGTMPVVISGKAGGTMVHEAVGHGLEADLAMNGMSVYADKIGQKVASELITVRDSALYEGKRGSFMYDDEGTKAKENTLIENGILKKYMSDVLYHLKKDIELTGNGRRQSYRNKPIVRMTNTTIEPGKSSHDEIVSSVDSGLYVVQMGGGQVNTVNGDFVFDVTEGYLIKNGAVDKPVRGATLIGNGPKVMELIDMVAADTGFGIGTCGKEGQGVPVADGQPTLRIPEITVGGK